MKKNKIVFLILHYLTLDETNKSIKSIRDKCKNHNYEIVIVDNASNNGTGKSLQKKYEKFNDIHVILSDKNLGFAKGNNIGFKYAKEKLKPDFIVMMNNDVYIIQYNFIDQIYDEYDKSNFSVLGPKIYLKNNEICNYPDKIETLFELKNKRLENKILYYLNKIYFRYPFSIILKIKRKFKKVKIVDTSIRKENVLLNGCCLIFSKNYIDKFDGLDDRTFLYYEEQLLFLRLQKNNMKSIFNPEIEVLHDEGASTNKKVKNKRKKFDFVLKNEIDSLNILIKELEK